MNKTAFIFPGQGSQSIGMLDSLAKQSTTVQKTFEEASQAASVDLWDIVQNGPKERIDKTEFTQPVMLAADIAVWRVWRELGGFEPDYMAGHSLGEFAALVAAGALEFGAAVRLVCERARLMQHATPEGTGAMAAILGMDDQELRQVCEKSAQGQVVTCANYNSPGQIVIAGDREAVARTCEAAKVAGAKRALMLPVSVPSHCDLMRPAAKQLQVSLESVSLTPGHIQVLHNVDVQSHDSATGLRSALVEQLFMPVRWTETITALASLGVARFAECGPGGVLAGLNRRIVRDAETKSLTDTDTMKEIMQEWS